MIDTERFIEDTFKFLHRTLDRSEDGIGRLAVSMKTFDGADECREAIEQIRAGIRKLEDELLTD